MSRTHLVAAAALAATGGLAVFLFTGTGPLSDSGTGPPSPPTPRVYAEKADKVCTDIEVKQADLDHQIFKGIPFNQSPPDSLYIKYVRALIPTYEDQMAKLRKITPPKGQEQKLKTYFAATEKAVALLHQVAADPKKIPQLGTTDVFTKADEAAKALDLKACGHAED